MLTAKSLVAVAVVIAALVAAPAVADAGTRDCGGRAIAHVWVGSSTSCSLGRRTRAKVVRIATRTGEIPASVSVRSPTTRRIYILRMTRRRRLARGRAGLVGVWTGEGDCGTRLAVYFWVP